MERTSCSIHFINAEGKRDQLPLGEMQEVERSGRSTWQAYIMHPGQWPEPSTAVVPLMEGRPGQTAPRKVGPSQGNKHWTIEEINELLMVDPKGGIEQAAYGERIGRTAASVNRVLDRLRELIRCRQLRWDGRRIYRGSKANVSQWPVGFRNPKYP